MKPSAQQHGKPARHDDIISSPLNVYFLLVYSAHTFPPTTQPHLAHEAWNYAVEPAHCTSLAGNKSERCSAAGAHAVAGAPATRTVAQKAHP